MTTVLATIPSPTQGVWELGPLPIRAYALCIVAGIVAAVWLTEKRWVARGGAPAFGGARLAGCRCDWGDRPERDATAVKGPRLRAGARASTVVGPSSPRAQRAMSL